MKSFRILSLIALFASLGMIGSGCEYSTDPATEDVARDDESTSATESSSSGGTSLAQPSNPSALSGAKRAADDVISQAEQASQNVANQAEQLGGGGD